MRNLLNNTTSLSNSRSILSWAISKRLILSVSSLISMLIMAAPNITAQAQAVSGDPQCPISGDTVTCTASIPNGFLGASDEAVNFNINNLTSSIAADNFGIGIVGEASDDVVINVDNTVNITLTDDPADGFDAAAILVEHEDGDVNLTSAATISGNSTIADHFGIRLEGDSGDQVITNTGNISITAGGTGASFEGVGAIGAVSGGSSTEISINNSGSLSLDTGSDLMSGAAAAIISNNFGLNTVTNINNSGDIDATGSITNGIVVLSVEEGAGVSQIDVDNSGDITVDGNNLAAINIQKGTAQLGSGLQDIFNSGTLTVNNASTSSGIQFITQANEATTDIENAGDIIINESVGIGFGIFADLTNLSGTGGDSVVNVLNSGNVTGNSGSIVNGIAVQSALADTVTVTLENTGTIDLTDTNPGFLSNAFVAQGDNAVGAGGDDEGVSTFVINNSGAILTASAAGAFNAIGDNVTINNSGTITSSTTGNNLVALNGLNTDSVINFTQSGTIAADNNGLDILNIGDTGTANITLNGGTISQVDTGGSGAVIRSLGAATNITLSEGTVTGDILTSSGNDSLLVSGSVVDGEINLGDGNDTIIFSGQNQIINGIQTGEGNDSVTIDFSAPGAATIFGSDTSFGSIGLGEGDDEVTLIGATQENFDELVFISAFTGTDTFNFNLSADTDIIIDQLPGNSLDVFNQTGSGNLVLQLPFFSNILNPATYNIIGGNLDDPTNIDAPSATFLVNAGNVDVNVIGDQSSFSLLGTINDLTVGGGFRPGAFDPDNLISLFEAGAPPPIAMIDGNFVFEDTGEFFLVVNSDGQSSLTSIEGTATINGGDLIVLPAVSELAFMGTQTFEFLTAEGGLTGEFSDIVSPDFAFVDLAVEYMPTSARLIVTRAMSPTVPMCTITENIALCQGFHADGIENTSASPEFTTPPVDTLNVNNLTANIAPQPNVRGIEFTNTDPGEININVDTGNFSIITEGDGADGLFAHNDGGGNINIMLAGNVVTSGAEANGIFANAEIGDTITINISDNTVVDANGVDANGIYLVGSPASQISSQTSVVADILIGQNTIVRADQGFAIGENEGVISQNGGPIGVPIDTNLVVEGRVEHEAADSVAISLAAGDDVINVVGDGAIDGDVDLGAGDDDILLQGDSEFRGDILLGEGTNTVTLENESFISVRNISGASQVSLLSAGNGNDTVTVRDGAFLRSDIDLGDGNNTILLEDEADIDGDISMGSGNDIITTSLDSDISGSLSLGAGNDIVNLQPFSFFGSEIDLGSGDDQINLTGLNVFGQIIGGDGTDTLSFNTVEDDIFTLDFDDSTPLATGFEIFNQDGLGIIGFTGENPDLIADFNLNGGATFVFANLPDVNFTTQAGTRFVGGQQPIEVPDPDTAMVTTDDFIGDLTVNGVLAPANFNDLAAVADTNAVTADTIFSSIGVLKTNNLTL